MAAKDYKICAALASAYIAKVSKRNPNLMLSDRREITESEILTLIDWLMNNACNEDANDNSVYFESSIREGKIIKMEFMDNPNKK